MKQTLSTLFTSKKNILIIGLFLLFFLAIILFYERNIFAIQFIDEDDNFTVGNFLLQGEKLYSNVFSQHQPLTYIISLGIEKVTHPSSIHSLVRRHREAIILFSILWDILLFLRFKYRVLPFIVTYELTKILMFGNLFLAETFAVYPTVYLTLIVLERQRKLQTIENCFLGFLVGFVFFMLAPLWPLLLLITALLIYNQRKKILEFILPFVIGLLPVIIPVLLFSSLGGYIHDAIFINLKYYVPVTNTGVISYLQGMFSPILAFLPSAPQTHIIWVIRFFLVCLFIATYYLIKKKKYLEILLIYLFLWLTNLRYVPAGGEIYSGFHLLPWFGLLLTFTGYFCIPLLPEAKKRARIIISSVLLVWLGVLIFAIFPTLTSKRNISLDLYINYSRQTDIGQIIKMLKNDNDTLFIKPAQSLIYWQAGIKHASALTYDYAWVDRVPELSKAIDDMFRRSPPTFVYCECLWQNYVPYALGNYADRYQELDRDNKGSRLFVLNTKVSEITPKQKEELNFYHYSFVTPVRK